MGKQAMRFLWQNATMIAGGCLAGYFLDFTDWQYWAWWAVFVVAKVVEHSQND